MFGIFHWLKKRKHPPRTPSQPRLKILALSIFLEDRFVLERLGKRYGWDLYFTRSVEDGFQHSAQGEFDLILCDRHQPGYPWREVMGRLAAASPRSRILLVSPANDDTLWQEVVRYGGHDILPRPLEESTVLLMILAADRLLAPLAEREQFTK